MKKELKNKTEKELKKLLLEKRNSLRGFRFQISKGKVKDVKEGRLLRKEVAMILTELNERAHAGQKK
ncbi:50S ribosomal protein L29 [Patescibacteria group bacterium]|nr:50S ribosomal protein L29 [Patescibacteria group bacterium]